MGCTAVPSSGGGRLESGNIVEPEEGGTELRVGALPGAVMGMAGSTPVGRSMNGRERPPALEMRFALLSGCTL